MQIGTVSWMWFIKKEWFLDLFWRFRSSISSNDHLIFFSAKYSEPETLCDLNATILRIMLTKLFCFSCYFMIPFRTKTSPKFDWLMNLKINDDTTVVYLWKVVIYCNKTGRSFFRFNVLVVPKSLAPTIHRICINVSASNVARNKYYKRGRNKYFWFNIFSSFQIIF